MPSSYPSSINLFDINPNDPQIIKFSGPKQDARLTSIYAQCDLNQDGFNDVIIGTPGLLPSTTGQVTVLFGPITSDQDLANPGNNSVVITSSVEENSIGEAIICADLNADGYSDIVFGERRGKPYNVLNAGRIYILFGSDSIPATIDLETSDNVLVINGEVANGFCGHALTAVDLNNDDYPDLVFSCPWVPANNVNGAGITYALFGGPNLSQQTSLNVSSINPTNGLITQGSSEDGNLGSSLSSASDLNGDGKPDLIIGESGSGTINVLYGNENLNVSSPIEPNAFNGINGTRISSGTSGDKFGVSVSHLGDFYGTGSSNIIAVGAHKASPDGKPNAGSVYLIDLTNENPAGSYNLSSLGNVTRIDGPESNDYCGRDVAKIWDINHDNKPEIGIGCYGSKTVHTLFGTNNPTQLNLSTLNGTSGFDINHNVGSFFDGIFVSTGDVNGDGISDVLVTYTNAAPYGRQNAGEAFAILGQSEDTTSSSTGTPGPSSSGVGGTGSTATNSGTVSSSTGTSNSGAVDTGFGTANSSTGSTSSASSKSSSSTGSKPRPPSSGQFSTFSSSIARSSSGRTGSARNSSSGSSNYSSSGRNSSGSSGRPSGRSSSAISSSGTDTEPRSSGGPSSSGSNSSGTNRPVGSSSHPRSSSGTNTAPWSTGVAPLSGLSTSDTKQPIESSGTTGSGFYSGYRSTGSLSNNESGIWTALPASNSSSSTGFLTSSGGFKGPTVALKIIEIVGISLGAVGFLAIIVILWLLYKHDKFPFSNRHTEKSKTVSGAQEIEEEMIDDTLEKRKDENTVVIPRFGISAPGRPIPDEKIGKEEQRAVASQTSETISRISAPSQVILRIENNDTAIRASHTRPESAIKLSPPSIQESKADSTTIVPSQIESVESHTSSNTPSSTSKHTISTSSEIELTENHAPQNSLPSTSRTTQFFKPNLSSNKIKFHFPENSERFIKTKEGPI